MQRLTGVTENNVYTWDANWTDIPQAGTGIRYRPVVTKGVASSLTDVYVVGTDYKIYNVHYSGQWLAAQPTITALVNKAPFAILGSKKVGNVETHHQILYFTGSRYGQVYQANAENTWPFTWSAATEVPPGNFSTDRSVSALRNNYNVCLYAVKTSDQVLYENCSTDNNFGLTANTWTGWQAVAGILPKTPPAALARCTNIWNTFFESDRPCYGDYSVVKSVFTHDADSLGVTSILKVNVN